MILPGLLLLGRPSSHDTAVSPTLTRWWRVLSYGAWYCCAPPPPSLLILLFLSL